MVLKKDARAVLQFYPETSEQAVIIAQAASKVIMNEPSQFSVWFLIDSVVSFLIYCLLFFVAGGLCGRRGY